jgi:hypothetical protein
LIDVPAADTTFPSKTQSAKITNIIQAVFMELSALASESKQETTVVLLARHSSKGGDSEATRRLKTRYESDKHLAQSPSSIKSGSPEDVSLLSVRRQTHIPSLLTPMCHSSNDLCAQKTQNCSDNGECYRKYRAKDSTEEDCYACRCKTQEIKNKDNTIKTIQWSGVACQKIDISTPFFILAGLSVLLVIAISWGINFLFTVGQEELPSVLSVGVAAPRLQK